MVMRMSLRADSKAYSTTSGHDQNKGDLEVRRLWEDNVVAYSPVLNKNGGGGVCVVMEVCVW